MYKRSSVCIVHMMTAILNWQQYILGRLSHSQPIKASEITFPEHIAFSYKMTVATWTMLVNWPQQIILITTLKQILPFSIQPPPPLLLPMVCVCGKWHTFLYSHSWFPESSRSCSVFPWRPSSFPCSRTHDWYAWTRGLCPYGWWNHSYQPFGLHIRVC